MNLRMLSHKNNSLYYLGILVIVSALSFYGLEFESVKFKYFCYLGYFIYSAFFIYWIYSKETIGSDILLLVIASFVYLVLFFIDEILAIPFILLYITVAFKKIKIRYIKLVTMTMYTLIVAIGIFALGINILFDGFSSEKIEDIYYSPNGQSKITVISVDLGATGGGTKAYIEKSYMGLLKLKRKVFVGGFGEVPTINWVNDNSVSIDGRIIELR